MRGEAPVVAAKSFVVPVPVAAPVNVSPSQETRFHAASVSPTATGFLTNLRLPRFLNNALLALTLLAQPEDRDVVIPELSSEGLSAEALRAAVGARELAINDGRLSEVVPLHDVVIDGIPLEGGEQIVFSNDGRVQRGRLAQSYTWHEATFAAGSVIGFDAYGNISEGILGEALQVGDLSLAAGTPVRFSIHGGLESARLQESLTLKGLFLPAGTELNFDDSGSLPFAQLSDVAAHTQNGLVFQAGTTVDFFPDFQVKSAHLAQPCEIDGARYAAGAIAFQSDGSVDDATLDEESEIGGVTYASGSTIRYGDLGRVLSGTLAKDQQIHVGAAMLQAQKGSWIYFNAAGDVSQLTLAGDQEIGGIWFQSGEPVMFGESGIVQTGTLARDFADPQHAGVLYGSGTQVTLYPDGRVENATFATGNQASVRGVFYAPGSAVHYFKNGEIETAVLGANPDFDGRRAHAGNQIRFDETGRIASETLLHPTEIDGILYRDGQAVSYHSNGQLESGVLVGDTQVLPGVWAHAGDRVDYSETGALVKLSLSATARYAAMGGEDINHAVEVNGLSFSLDRDLEFYDNGQVKSGRMIEASLSDGVATYAPDHDIAFYPNGNIAYATLAENARVGGYVFAADKVIYYDESGRVDAATFAYDQPDRLYPEIILEGGSAADFDRDGSVMYGTLAIAYDDGFARYAAGTATSFFDDGRVAEGTLGEELTLAGITVPAGSEVSFENPGILKHVKLAAPSAVHGVAVPSGAEIWPQKSGNPFVVTVTADTEIGGKTVSAGAVALISDDGSVSVLQPR